MLIFLARASNLLEQRLVAQIERDWLRMWRGKPCSEKKLGGDYSHHASAGTRFEFISHVHA